MPIYPAVGMFPRFPEGSSMRVLRTRTRTTLVACLFGLLSPGLQAADHGHGGGEAAPRKGETARRAEPEPRSARDSRAAAVEEESVGSRRSKGKSRDTMSSEDAIEQLSTRIVEKLGAMRADSARRTEESRIVVTPKAAPRPAAGASMVRTAYGAAESDVAAQRAKAHGEAGAAPARHAAQAAPGHGPSADAGSTNSPTATALAAAHRQTAGHGSAVRTATAGQAAAASAAPSGHGDGHAHWSYGGETGPEHWGRLKPEFAKCSAGTRQSPIDIREGFKVELDPIRFDYRPSGFGVVDNGHTVQVNLAPGNAITVGGRRYDLVQFHFHRPSEERIEGRQYDMVAHMVHKDAEGRLAVVAVLIERGNAHPAIQTVWNNLPLERNEELAAQVALDVGQLLPAERSYFTYMGSLTTPPCSEGVLWMVLKTPVQVSEQQVAIFSRLYPMNARPVQVTAGRVIKESN
jgi:carbonic anhydrase